MDIFVLYKPPFAIITKLWLLHIDLFIHITMYKYNLYIKLLNLQGHTLFSHYVEIQSWHQATQIEV